MDVPIFIIIGILIDVVYKATGKVAFLLRFYAEKIGRLILAFGRKEVYNEPIIK